MKLALSFIFLTSLLFNTVSLASGLTQSDVDKVVKTTPEVTAWFEKSKSAMSKEAMSAIGEGTFDGTLYKAFGKAAENNVESTKALEVIAIKNGFSSYSEFANAADKAYSLLAVNTLMSVSALPFNGPKVTNVYKHLTLDSTPDDEKKRLEGYLPDMYQRMNADPSDLPIVLANFNSLKAVLIR